MMIQPNMSEALPTLIKFIQEMIDVHMRNHFPNNPPVKIYLDSGGRKYARIVKEDTQKSVYCFVDLTNGDILKAASWNAPAKGARGNIFKPEDWTKALTPYGAAYFRG